MAEAFDFGADPDLRRKASYRSQAGVALREKSAKTGGALARRVADET